jgi:hypothetical protein
LIRHIGERVEWRRTVGGDFLKLAINITNDADGDGNVAGESRLERIHSLHGQHRGRVENERRRLKIKNSARWE